LGSSFLRWEDHEAKETTARQTFGVELVQPVDSYRMTRRSIK
jgi:inner membrane protein involved in colicin E2 resistance